MYQGRFSALIYSDTHGIRARSRHQMGFGVAGLACSDCDQAFWVRHKSRPTLVASFVENQCQEYMMMVPYAWTVSVQFLRICL